MFYAIFDLLGITGNRGRPRLEVCPRLPVHLLVCVLVCRHLQTQNNPNTPPRLEHIYTCIYTYVNYIHLNIRTEQLDFVSFSGYLAQNVVCQILSKM